jgi:hypothetical protein
MTSLRVAAVQAACVLMDRAATLDRGCGADRSGSGTGVILRDGINVCGINTAATIWCSAAALLAAAEE